MWAKSLLNSTLTKQRSKLERCQAAIIPVNLIDRVASLFSVACPLEVRRVSKSGIDLSYRFQPASFG